MLKMFQIAVLTTVAILIINSFIPKRSSPPSRPAITNQTRPVERIELVRNIWMISRGTSAIDDSKSVFLVLKSDNPVPGTFGEMGAATLQVRCLENTTSITFNFNDNFLAEIQGYGRVTYRVDDHAARTVNMKVSTDNKWLGLWRGGQAIPMVKRLFGGDRMVVRATPYNESSVEVNFNIKGLADRIRPLREACNW